MILYTSHNKRLNDSWYCFDGEKYHSFCLEYPYDAPEDGMWNKQSIGHFVSSDLIEWTYDKTVLAPEHGSWDDMGLATGSTVNYNGKWYMLYTGNSYSGISGFGLAQSDDLFNWTRVGTKPVIDRSIVFTMPYNGQNAEVKLLADPYIYPDTVNGYFYAYFNAILPQKPMFFRGAQAIMRSKNLIDWEPYKVAASVGLTRMETSQVWKHGDRWYMYFGAVTTNTDTKEEHFENFVYTSDNMFDGFHECGNYRLPDRSTFYIAKVLKNPENREVFLANKIPDGVIGPYKIEYPKDGGIIICE